MTRSLYLYYCVTNFHLNMNGLPKIGNTLQFENPKFGLAVIVKIFVGFVVM